MKPGLHNHVPLSQCRSCGKDNDAATNAEGRHVIPSEGDVSICFYCGTIAIYNAELTLRAPTSSEQVELDANPDIQRFRQSLKDAQSRKMGTP